MLMKNEKTSDRGLIDRADVQQFEQVPLADQYLPTSTYDMLSKGMSINPDAVALSFFSENNGLSPSLYLDASRSAGGDYPHRQCASASGN